MAHFGRPLAHLGIPFGSLSLKLDPFGSLLVHFSCCPTRFGCLSVPSSSTWRKYIKFHTRVRKPSGETRSTPVCVNHLEKKNQLFSTALRLEGTLMLKLAVSILEAQRLHQNLHRGFRTAATEDRWRTQMTYDKWQILKPRIPIYNRYVILAKFYLLRRACI